jgi:hypothetical protein
MYNVAGHGRGWVEKNKATYAKVRLLCGETVQLFDKKFLDDIA